MNKKKIYRFIALWIFLIPLFFSCTIKAERKPLTSALDQIDVLINQKQYKDAKAALIDVEKKAYEPWGYIGIFKRYNLLGEYGAAEKILVKAVKKYPKNQELHALYSNFLLRRNRVEEAVDAGKILQGTIYGSLYSEAVFKKAELEGSSLKSELEAHDYFPVYYDAYTGTKDNMWLRNCALLELASGSYKEAAGLRPSVIYEAEDAYFWALVMYDSARYGDTVNYAQKAFDLLKKYPSKIVNKFSAAELTSIEADAYSKLQDEESAEKVRRSFLKTIYLGKDIWNVSNIDDSANLLPVIFTNSAKWAEDNGDDSECASLISFTVNNWSDFVPALALYSSFSWRTSTPRKEDFQQMALRDQGLTTLEMEKYDSRIQIPISDAVHKIEDSLKRTNDPLLFIIRLDLKYKMDTALSTKEKTADVWKLLEKNASGPGLYPALMIEYAQNYFLEKKQYSDAWNLFHKYICANYSVSPQEYFWQDLIKNLENLSLGEAENAAYFAAHSLRSEDALRIYEHCVFERGGDRSAKVISPKASDSCCINLAMIYNSLGKKQNAVELYSKIAGRTCNIKIKSAVMYRMALIYSALSDLKNAKRCAEYAVTLNNRNAEAKLLLNRIRKFQ